MTFRARIWAIFCNMRASPRYEFHNLDLESKIHCVKKFSTIAEILHTLTEWQRATPGALPYRSKIYNPFNQGVMDDTCVGGRYCSLSFYKLTFHRSCANAFRGSLCRSSSRKILGTSSLSMIYSSFPLLFLTEVIQSIFNHSTVVSLRSRRRLFSQLGTIKSLPFAMLFLIRFFCYDVLRWHIFPRYELGLI